MPSEIYGRFSGLFWNELRRISHFVSVHQGLDANLWYSYWRKRLQFRLFRAMVSPHLYAKYGRRAILPGRQDIGEGLREYMMGRNSFRLI